MSTIGQLIRQRRLLERLRRHSPFSTIEVIIKNQTTSDPRTNFHIQHVALIAPKSIATLAERPHIAVVIQIHRDTK